MSAFGGGLGQSCLDRAGEIHFSFYRIVAYRESSDAYVVRRFPLTTLDAAGTAALNDYIASLRAAGGGDWPETLDAALDAATSMAWRWRRSSLHRCDRRRARSPAGPGGFQPQTHIRMFNAPDRPRSRRSLGARSPVRHAIGRAPDIKRRV
jgi:hypothetical protein